MFWYILVTYRKEKLKNSSYFVLLSVIAAISFYVNTVLQRKETQQTYGM